MSSLNYIIAFVFVLLGGGSGPSARPKQRQMWSCRGRRRRWGGEKRLYFSSAAWTLSVWCLDVCEGSLCVQRTVLKSNFEQKKKKVCFLHGEFEYRIEIKQLFSLRLVEDLPYLLCDSCRNKPTTNQFNFQNQTKDGHFQDWNDRK